MEDLINFDKYMSTIKKVYNPKQDLCVPSPKRDLKQSLDWMLTKKKLEGILCSTHPSQQAHTNYKDLL